MKVLKRIKGIYIARKILLILFILIFCFFVGLFTSLPIEEKMNEKAMRIIEEMVLDYIDAYKEQDLNKIVSFYYPIGSNEYNEFIENNPYYFVTNENIVLKNSTDIEITYVYARYGEGSIGCDVYYTDEKNKKSYSNVWFSFKLIKRKWFMEEPNINNPNNNNNDMKPPLRVNKDIQTYTVKESDHIDHMTFSECTKLLEVTFPGEFQEINPQWFYNCRNLISIKVKDGPFYHTEDGVLYSKDKKNLIFYPAGKIQVKNSQNGVFAIPDTVTTISPGAFANTIGLKKVILSSSVRTILINSFSDSYNLEEIILNEGLETINDGAFYNCQKLKKVTLPSTVTKIGNECFYHCENIAQFNIPRNSKLISLGYGAFEKCLNITEIYLPDRLENIGNWCFQNCYYLKNIRLPENLNNIGMFAFRNCAYLEEVTLIDVNYVDKGAFSNCATLKLEITKENDITKWNKDWNMELRNAYILID